VAHKVSVIGIVSNASSGDLLVGAVGAPYPAGLILSTVPRKSVPFPRKSVPFPRKSVPCRADYQYRSAKISTVSAKIGTVSAKMRTGFGLSARLPLPHLYLSPRQQP
jgi:hypothetical protein